MGVYVGNTMTLLVKPFIARLDEVQEELLYYIWRRHGRWRRRRR